VINGINITASSGAREAQFAWFPAMPPARPLMRSGGSLGVPACLDNWEMPPSSYDQFAQGYADTASVQLIV
jgi:hypothetical protein